MKDKEYLIFAAKKDGGPWVLCASTSDWEEAVQRREKALIEGNAVVLIAENIPLRTTDARTKSKKKTP